MGLTAPIRVNAHRTIRVLLLILAALALSASYAQTTPIRMSPAKSPFPDDSAAKWVKIDGSGGHKFLAAILRPKGPGPFPVVVVLHGADGLRIGYMSVALDVARAGFLVVYGCWQAGEGLWDGNRICSEASPQAEWVADPAAHSGKELIAMARTLPDARADRIGLYGLSRGGHAALWAASTGAGVQAVVVDAPAHLPMITPAPAKTLDVLPGLAAPLLMMHGTKDSVIPVEQSREYEKAARALGKPLDVVYFEGVEHMVSLQPESEVEARNRAIAFLREHLMK